eukprot:4439358-Amphidinium_carterae.2
MTINIVLQALASSKGKQAMLTSAQPSCKRARLRGRSMCLSPRGCARHPRANSIAHERGNLWKRHRSHFLVESLSAVLEGIGLQTVSVRSVSIHSSAH